MNETTFKTMFWINQAKIYTKSEDLSVVNYIGLHFQTLGVKGIYH